MRFHFFVEGDTEKRVLPVFLRRWLDDRLPARVGIDVTQFTGWQEFEGNITKRVHLVLDSPKHADVIAAIGLLDTLGPGFYPKGVTTAAERYEWGKRRFEAAVARRDRFRQHFAVHEIEAWLLADRSIFPGTIARQIPEDQAEQVNFNEPPSKLLARLYRSRVGHSFRKTIDGVALFAKLDPEAVYRKCPRFKALGDDLLALARARLDV